MGDGLRNSERRDFAGDAGSSARNLLSGRNSEGKIREYEKKLYEKKWLDLPWQKVRESMEVKRFEQEGELYGLAKSEGRQAGGRRARGRPRGKRGRHSSFMWTRKNSRNKKRNGVTDITCYAPT